MSDLRTSLTAVAVGNLLPLALVLGGLVDFADLLVCFALETVLLAAVAEGSWWDRVRLGWVFLVIALVLGFRALLRVTWDLGSVVGIAGCLAASAAGLWWAHRGGELPRTGLGTLLWRGAVVLLGGVVGLGWVDDLASASPLSPDGGLGRWLNEQALSLDAEPIAVAAVVLVLVKTWNEAAHATYRHLRPTTGLAPGPGP